MVAVLPFGVAYTVDLGIVDCDEILSGKRFDCPLLINRGNEEYVEIADLDRQDFIKEKERKKVCSAKVRMATSNNKNQEWKANPSWDSLKSLHYGGGGV